MISSNLQREETQITFSNSTAIVYYSFLGQGIPPVPKGLSGRILIFSICLTGGLFFWSYSAGLVSFLTIEKFEFPVQTVEVSIKLFVLHLNMSSVLLESLICIDQAL